MKKVATLLLIVAVIASAASTVSSQEKTRNPFAVGFQFDKFYYEPNSTGNVKIWVISWVDAPLYIGAIFIHFDWMNENESISLIGLNVSVSQYTPVVVGSLNFTIPNVEAGWYGYAAAVYYTGKLGGRWIQGGIRVPDPMDQREFGHEMYLLSIGHPIGEGNVPILYWDVYNYTEKVRRGEFLTVWVNLGNVGKYYVPSIHALLRNDLGEIIAGTKPVNIYSGMIQPYPLLFLSEGVPSGVRVRLFWKIPENYSLGSHNITLLIVSGQVPQDTKILNFTVLKSYSEEAEEKLDLIDRFLKEIEGLVNLSKEVGIKIKDIDLLSIKDEYDQGTRALLTGDDKLALEHAEKGMQLVNSIKDQMKPLMNEVEKEITEIGALENIEVREHIDKANTALERAKNSENPVDWVTNMTVVLEELIQAKKLAGGKTTYIILLATSISLVALVLFILKKKR